MIWHAFPIDDSVAHNTNNTLCDCEPEIVDLGNGDLMVKHNAYDGRELLEQANKILEET